MKRGKWHILFGAVIVWVIFLFALFPEIIASDKIYSAKSIIELTESEYFSLLANGIQAAAAAAVVVAAIRLAVAVPIGIFSGLGSTLFGGLARLFESVLKIVPANLAVLAILAGVSANESLRGQFPVLAVAVLSLAGWSGPAVKISREMKKLSEGRLSKGREAAGHSRALIALGNVLQVLKDHIPSMFFDQAARVLTMLAQLCIFFWLFEGFAWTSGSASLLAFENNGAISRLIPYWHLKPWLALYPGLAFFTGIFACKLLSQGFEKGRKDPAEEKEGNINPIAAAVFVLASLVLIALFVNKNIFVKDFSIAEIRRSIVFERTGEMIPGSPEAFEGAERMALELEKIGFLPLGDSFTQKYERDAVVEPIYDELVWESGGARTSYQAGKDYFADSFGVFDVSGEVFDGRRMDYYSMEERYGEFSGRWILVERREYSKEDIMAFSERILEDSEASGVIVASGGLENRFSSQGRALSKKPVLAISEKMAEKLTGGKGRLSYRQIAKSNGNEGINVLAKIEAPENKKGKTVLVGLSYGWQYEPIKSGKLDFGLELASQLAKRREELEADVALAFFDMAGGADREGMAYFSNNLPAGEDEICLFMDLTQVYGDVSGCIRYGARAGGECRGYSACAGEIVDSILSRGDYPFEQGQAGESDSGAAAYAIAAEAVSMGFYPCRSSSMDIEDFGDVIVETILRLGH